MVFVACLFAALEIGRGFGEIGVDTLVVSKIGPGSLPYLFIGLGAIGLITSLAYGAALGRVPRIPLLAGLLDGAAVILLLEAALMATGAEATILLAWLTVYAIGAIGVTIAWTMAGSVFDARQARRLFPLCTGAAIAGSFVGTLSSGPVARAFGTEILIVLEAVMLAVVGGLVVAVSRTTTVRAPVRQRDRSIVAELRLGFDTVLRSPLMRLVAIAYVLLAILGFSVTYPFLLSASGTFTNEADLATALGVLSAAVTATSFIVSVVLANRVYSRFGVTGAALLLPIVYLGGFALWLVAFSFSTAALFRFTQQVTQRGVTNSAWSAFYNVIPRERRAQVLAFNDGVPGQVGTILSGFLLLAAGSILALDQVFLLGAITALACTIVVLGIRRSYRASVLDSLSAGLAEQVLEGGPGSAALARDPAVSDSLVAALTAPEPGVRQMAASLLAQGAMERAGPALIRVVDDDLDPRVRATALDALATLGGPPSASPAAMACLLDDDAGVRAAALRTVGAVGADDPAIDTHPWVEALADDPSPAVRGALAGLYGAHGPDPRSTEIVLELLAAPADADRLVGLETDRRLGGTVPADHVSALVKDPSPPIRAAALAALAARDDADGVIVDSLVRALDDDADEVRIAASRALSERETTPRGLLEVLANGSNRAQEAALIALRGHGPDVRAAVIAWTLHRLDRATDLRRARMALAAEDPADRQVEPALVFLLAILARREALAVRLALRALVVLGVAEAGGVIRRCLYSDDPEVRAQAIEALDSIGDRELPSALVRLLEDEAIEVRDRDAVLARLSDDDDPWISGLARRVRGGEDAMPDTSRTLGDLDTMLFLRRVPLFDGLEPEDLHRIAMTSVEHVYPAGEALVREGDVGDELIVIVEGSVRVVHIDAAGTERLIRRYESGDHIGELAVLREAPRAATVIAEGEGVRGLVIGGAALKSMLRERPEAAMAMLAELAERISRQ